MTSYNFPPCPEHLSEIKNLIGILRSVVEERKALYLSVPITSGLRFSKWLQRQDEKPDLAHPAHRDSHRREVIEPNRDHARTLARRLREEFGKVLIDPTGLEDLPGWTQDDYRYFWACVIEQYVDTAIFTDGWQYSNGCAFEFLTALRSGANIFSEKLKPLTLEQGVELISSSITQMREAALETKFLESVRSELMFLSVDSENVLQESESY